MMAVETLPKYALPRAYCAVIETMAWSYATEVHLAANLDAYTSQAIGAWVHVNTEFGVSPSVATYILNVGPSGSGKTPMGKPFQRRFDGLVHKYDAATKAAWHEYDGRTAFWNAERIGSLKAAQRQAASGQPADETLQLRLMELEKNKPSAPLSPPRRLDDFTLPSLRGQAARHRAIFMHSDEGSAILASLEKDMVGTLCSAWSGMPINFGRGKADVELIELVPTVMWCVQNSAFTEFRHTPRGTHFFGVGAANRFLYFSTPEGGYASERGTHAQGDDTELCAFLDATDSFFREQIAQQKAGWIAPKELSCGPSATRVLQSVDRHLQRLRSRESDPTMQGYLAKMLENIIRFAARSHVIDGGAGVLTGEEIERAEELVSWSYGNFIRLVESEPPGTRNVDNDANNLSQLLHELRVRGMGDMIELKALRDAAFNVGLIRPTQFNDALGLLCIENRTVLRDGYVYLA